MLGWDQWNIGLLDPALLNVCSSLKWRIFYNHHGLFNEGVWHEIFDFHDANPFGPLIKGLEYFQILFRFRPYSRIRSETSKILTPRCAWHSGVNILGLVNPQFYFKSFLSWYFCFTLKGFNLFVPLLHVSFDLLSEERESVAGPNLIIWFDSK